MTAKGRTSAGTRWRARVVRLGLGACLLAGASIQACGFLTLRKDMAQADRLVALEGRADVRGPGGGPVVVVAHDVAAGRTADVFLLPKEGPFFFTLPAGTYQVAAFEDRNRNLSYEPTEEPAVLFDDPTTLALDRGEHRADLDLSIDPEGGAHLPFAVNGAQADGRVNHLPSPQLGTIVDIDDPRFSDDNAQVGLWDPLRFLFDVGAGVYFLEPYDPDRIPVLFVHGAVGHPGNWAYLISRLDRRRFQPWVAYYPTAPHLDRVGEMLVRALGALQVKYQFPKLIVVSHSMGGLVTRAALNRVVQDLGADRVVHVPAFVSISSPWNGHKAAAAGVEYAPVVVPSWEDLAPGSAFLTRLPQTPMPTECEYSLFFSYGGDSPLFGEANDGTVTVASELSMPIQRQAARVLGFDETHDAILRSADVADALNAILARVGP